MKMKSLCRVFLPMMAGLGGMARAQEGAVPGALVTVSQRIVVEDNLYRLPGGVDPQRGGRSDLVSMTRLGVGLRQTVGLQQLSAGAGVTAARYRDNGHLDYDGVDAEGAWHWTLGRALGGQLAVRQTQALSGFDDFTAQERSLNTYRRLEFTGDHALTSRWFWGLGASYTSSDYSGDTRPTGDYRARGLSLRSGYCGHAGERITLTLGRTVGDYPNRTASTFADQEYTQNDYRVSGAWTPTGVTRLSGYLGYLTRRYDFAENRDYDGAVGRIEMDWRPTGKLRVNSHVRREIGAQEDLVDNYVVTDAVAVRPSWSLTDKVELSSEFELRRRDFGGDPGFLPEGEADRSEHLRRIAVSAAYRYSRALGLGASLRWESRSADSGAREFDAGTASVSASLQF